jgi:hypothetical protein
MPIFRYFCSKLWIVPWQKITLVLVLPHTEHSLAQSKVRPEKSKRTCRPFWILVVLKPCDGGITKYPESMCRATFLEFPWIFWNQKDLLSVRCWRNNYPATLWSDSQVYCSYTCVILVMFFVSYGLLGQIILIIFILISSIDGEKWASRSCFVPSCFVYFAL